MLIVSIGLVKLTSNLTSLDSHIKGYTMLYSAIDGTLHSTAQEAQAYNAEWRKGL
jgi:hypothetical protein